MSTLNFAELTKMAEDAGYGGLLDPGPYTLESANANGTTTPKGAKFGVQWKVIDGPSKGSMWENQHLVSTSPQNINICFRWMERWGVDAAMRATNPSPEAIAAHIASRPIRITANVTQKSDPKPDGSCYPPKNEMTGVQVIGPATGVTAPTAPIPPAAPAAAVPPPAPAPAFAPPVAPPAVADPPVAAVPVPVPEAPAPAPVAAPAPAPAMPAAAPAPEARPF